MVLLRMNVLPSVFLYLVMTVTAVRKTSRDAAHVGYLYDKPTQVLDVPENGKEVADQLETAIEEEIKKEIGILVENPEHKPLDDYLPPHHDPLNLATKETLETIENEEISEALKNRKRESVKGKHGGHLHGNTKRREILQFSPVRSQRSENTKGKPLIGNKAVFRSQKK